MTSTQAWVVMTCVENSSTFLYRAYVNIIVAPSKKAAVKSTLAEVKNDLPNPGEWSYKCTVKKLDVNALLVALNEIEQV
jgi:hypothetical protein